MLSRKTTQVLANIYNARFTEVRMTGALFGGSRRVVVLRDELYDYLYERDYEAWLCNVARTLSGEQAIKGFLMRLHTGESIAFAKKDQTSDERCRLGQQLLRRLAEDILIHVERNPSLKTDTPILLAQLELDGYVFRNGKLYESEAGALDTEEEQGLLSQLLGDLNLAEREVTEHHLELSTAHYLEGKWDDSIANSRKFLESTAREVAVRHCLVKTPQPLAEDVYKKPVKVREYLEKARLLSSDESQALAKVYGLLSGTGGHPYMAEKDQARLMRILALTFSQFVLLRLQGALREEGEVDD